MIENNEGELKKRLNSTLIFGIVHQKLISTEIDEILNDIKSEFPIKFYNMEPQKNKIFGEDWQEGLRVEIDIPSPQEMVDLFKWFERWFGKSTQST
jgi:hypothetical protein